jgi:diacylglycerol kinase family enzyme
MKKALLIYNPSSGRRREHRTQQVAKALAIFRAAGVEAESCATTHVGSAVAQTQAAVSAGFDAVIGCGGDGTANEILNGLMLANSSASLGVLPFGSGNVLATDLRLPSHTEAAARTLLTYRPRELHPGLLCYQEGPRRKQRYFIVVAGVGSDAELMYRTAVDAKERYGVYAYFMEMFRMILKHRLPRFRVEWKEAESIDPSRETVEQKKAEGNADSVICPDRNGSQTDDYRSAEVAMVMAVRAHRFSGLLRRVRLDIQLTHNQYHLMLFRTQKVRHFLNFFGSLMSGINWNVRQVEQVYSTWFRCTALPSDGAQRIHSEVDGELLGTLPVEVSIAPGTFRLLMRRQQLVLSS